MTPKGTIGGAFGIGNPSDVLTSLIRAGTGPVTIKLHAVKQVGAKKKKMGGQKIWVPYRPFFPYRWGPRRAAGSLKRGQYLLQTSKRKKKQKNKKTDHVRIVISASRRFFWV